MKKLFTIFAILFVASTVFAQTANFKTGITDSDVKAFVKNYDAISAKAKEHAQAYSENKLDPNAYKDMEETFIKCGISSPKAVEKVAAITAGAGYLIAKKELDKDATKVQIMKNMGVDPYQAIENLKANIHKDDMQVIQKNKDLLLTVKLVTKDDVQKIRENPEVKKLEDQAKKEAKEYLKNEFKKNAKDTKDQLKKDGKKLLKNFMN